MMTLLCFRSVIFDVREGKRKRKYGVMTLWFIIPVSYILQLLTYTGNQNDVTTKECVHYWIIKVNIIFSIVYKIVFLVILEH